MKSKIKVFQDFVSPAPSLLVLLMGVFYCVLIWPFLWAHMSLVSLPLFIRTQVTLD